MTTDTQSAQPSSGQPDHAFANTVQSFELPGGKQAKFYSLPELARQYPNIGRLPISIRIVLESVLRNCDGKKVGPEHVEQLANWQASAERSNEIPFVVARVVLQDFTGVPLLADLAAMRNVAASMGKDPKTIEPLVPVDLVVDHSVMIDYFGTKEALDLNMKLEFQRNRERYEFMKWGMEAFDTFGVVPPGFGIVHQVNLEYLARGVHKRADGIYYPDTLVGTDSHTTMINGIGVVGWGVGGIEAEAGMLGQPVYFLTPDVVGFELTGQLREGVTATDLVLTVTEILRKEKVVGKFVEFFGEGTASLSVPDRATIANMAPEYGATMGFFPVDEKTIEYFRGTGRTDDEIAAFEAYFKAQGMFGVPRAGQHRLHQVVKLDLGDVTPSLAGPKRPQDRIELGTVKRSSPRCSAPRRRTTASTSRPSALQTRHLVHADKGAPPHHAEPPATLSPHPAEPPGAARELLEMTANRPTLACRAARGAARPAGDRRHHHRQRRRADRRHHLVHQHLQPERAAGRRPAGEEGGRGRPEGRAAHQDLARPRLAHRHRVPGEGRPAALPGEARLQRRRLRLHHLHRQRRRPDARDQRGDHQQRPGLRRGAVGQPQLRGAHPPEPEGQLPGQPAAGGGLRHRRHVTGDLMTEPVGKGKDGQDVFLGDIWPTSDEMHALMKYAMDGEAFRANYGKVSTEPGQLWEAIGGRTGQVYDWPTSTYIAKPPFFDDFTMEPPAAASGVEGARIMALFGDSITTDHISPAGSIKDTSPAGQYLLEHGVGKADFNCYGSRRGNHEVMMRGTFANVRIKNLMLPPGADGSREEGGFTLYQPGGEKMAIYDAAMKYMADGVPTVIFAGEEYGTGSSRDWAAKGTQLLGIKAVVAKSFERIHRTNLVGMGVLPLQFKGGQDWQSLGPEGRRDDRHPPRRRDQAAGRRHA